MKIRMAIIMGLVCSLLPTSTPAVDLSSFTKNSGYNQTAQQYSTQDIRNKILNAIENTETSVTFKLDTGSISSANEYTKELLKQLEVDSAYLMFRIKKTKINVTSSIMKNTSTVTLMFDYCYSAEQDSDLRQEVASIEAGLFEPTDSNPQKVVKIHDYIAQRLVYDRSDQPIRDAYNALKYNKAVCQGYSHLAKLMFDEAGIPSTIVISEEMNHCWNKVYLGGKWVNVDITWDDSGLQTNDFSTEYLLVTDAELIDRSWNRDRYDILNDIK